MADSRDTINNAANYESSNNQTNSSSRSDGMNEKDLKKQFTDIYNAINTLNQNFTKWVNEDTRRYDESSRDKRDTNYQNSGRKNNTSGYDDATGLTGESARRNRSNRFHRDTDRFKSVSDAFIDAFTGGASKAGELFEEGLKRNIRSLNEDMGMSTQEVATYFGNTLRNALLNGGKDLKVNQWIQGLNKTIGSKFGEGGSKFAEALNKFIPDNTSWGFQKLSDIENYGQDFAKDLNEKRSKFWDSEFFHTSATSNQNGFVMSTGISNKDALKQGLETGDFGQIFSIIKNFGSSVLGLSGGITGLIGGVAKLSAGFGATLIPLLAFKATTALLGAGFNYLMKNVNEVGEGIEDLFNSLSKAANRDQTTASKNLEYAQKRLESDVETLVKTPFEILEKAAQEWYDAWDSNLRTINATQGYTKSDFQELMSSYSQRLRDEGLDSYISGADLTDNLTKVLQAGLSGDIAEEFAYQATKLNAAIPTEDFFSYADTYASIAANAVKQGESQSQAISDANDALSDFANSLLYASRNLAGGFSSSLSNVSETFTEAAKISQAGRSYDTSTISKISSVLLAIEAEVGSTAPDLASSITDTIYKLMTGGNSDDLVALRSLAGVNASNTEFLQQFIQNPQKIAADMFTNLANMYDQSSDAYMEKAESYASLFGLSSEAFQRINFRDLASSILSMSSTSSSLDENMSLLKDGQTTTNADILKNQQVNQFMIDNGLSLVLDNEAGRAIQQHMWEEQISREMMEATYGVELVGDTKSALQKILNSVTNILNFLNPFSWGKKIANVIQSNNEESALESDIKKVLQQGAVGTYRESDFTNLTTRNRDLKLTQSLVTLMNKATNVVSGAVEEQTPSYKTYMYSNGLRAYDAISNLLGGNWSTLYNQSKSASLAAKNEKLNQAYEASRNRNISSSYSWGNLAATQGRNSYTKSQSALASAILETGASTSTSLPAVKTVSTSSGTALSASAAKLSSSIDKMVSQDYLEKYVKNGTGYSGWAASASQNGISDLNEALDQAGYSATDIQNYFQDRSTEEGIAEQYERNQREEEFWQISEQFYQTDFVENWQDPALEKMNNQIDLMNTQIDWLNKIKTAQDDWAHLYTKQWLEKQWPAYFTVSGNSGLFNKFYNEFMNYFVKHTYYDNTSGYDYASVERVQKKSKKKENDDVVYSLAEMLTKNAMDLKDPEMQTNALLAEILIVVNAIQNQTNNQAGTTGTSKVLESLQSMALGMTTTTT